MSKQLLRAAAKQAGIPTDGLGSNAIRHKLRERERNQKLADSGTFWSWLPKPVTHVPMLDKRTGETRLVRLAIPMPRVLLTYHGGPVSFPQNWRITQKNGDYVVSAQPPVAINGPTKATTYVPGERWVKVESLNQAEMLAWLTKRVGSRAKLVIWALEDGGCEL